MRLVTSNTIQDMFAKVRFLLIINAANAILILAAAECKSLDEHSRRII